MNKQIIESFHHGHCLDAYKVFGAHLTTENKVKGVKFTVYAPNALKVSVVGEFNGWNEDNHGMKKITEEGIYTLFVPDLKQYDIYKFRIEDRHGNTFDKADPYAYFNELRPNTASLVYDLSSIKWNDQKWMKSRTKNFDKPVNIYEVYAGGWKRYDDRPYSFEELKETLIPYVKENGFTHIEFMPLTEYPYDGSWGYQVSGYYACTSRYGNPTELASFIDECHKNNIGVIMDMVPVHFVKDSHGLRLFDGDPVYEYRYQKDANSQWGTLNFDLWKEEVRSFLISSASFWCDIYHVDGIRIDAVSNLIYWEGNRDRGTNEGSLAFIRRMNYYLHEKYPGLMLIAEDSSDFPNVTEPTSKMGLGFDYKWDLGWMNDTLKYYKTDPLYRVWDHHKITFSMAYFYSERFLMPLSHDEVVHGKKTIVDQMWGDYDQKFAQVKNLYVYMYAHPGKKLNFMGNELGMFREFDESRELDWMLLEYDRHRMFAQFFKDLGNIYLSHPALYKYDYDFNKFKWIDADNTSQSIYSFYREDEDEYIVCIMNLSVAQYDSFLVGVPQSGSYKEIINTDSAIYDGSDFTNKRAIRSKKQKEALRGYENAISVKVAPFGAMLFTSKKVVAKKTVKKTKKGR
ncbi:MAG: 1,4-alpha-glucan branching protein GlgB [Erysipelotrichaceae bacterium]|nr:1,4-alpha-glucan branching protein GlgB [Erysipelotrichaceae bacterium]